MLVSLGFFALPPAGSLSPMLAYLSLINKYPRAAAVKFSSVIDARRGASSHPNKENKRSHPMEFVVMLLRYMATLHTVSTVCTSKDDKRAFLIAKNMIGAKIFVKIQITAPQFVKICYVHMYIKKCSNNLNPTIIFSGAGGTRKMFSSQSLRNRKRNSPKLREHSYGTVTLVKTAFIPNKLEVNLQVLFWLQTEYFQLKLHINRF